jgi:hypothetical protein
MAVGRLDANGFYSSIHKDNLTPWYSLISENELIEFKEGAIQRELNSLLIEAEATPLYIQILPSEYCLYIPANGSRSYDFEAIKAIKVLNVLGTKIRFSGMYF